MLLRKSMLMSLRSTLFSPYTLAFIFILISLLILILGVVFF